MVAIIAKRKSSDSTDRSATDKYWCLLFFFTCIIWLMSWYYASYHHNQPGSKVDSDNSSTNNSIKLDKQYFGGENWLLDTITCNVAFLSEHIEKSGSFVIFINVLYCGFLIVYSLSTMRKDKIFYIQLQWAGVCLIICTFYYRIVTYDIFSQNQDQLPSYVPYHENLSFWLMPELMFFIILYAKKPYRVIDITERTGKSLFSLMNIIFHMMIIAFLLFLSLVVFVTFTLDILEKLGKDCILSYVISGCSVYISLSILYFYLMTMSCSTLTILVLDNETVGTDWTVFTHTPFRALIDVGRYHFGTACYHATLIFPRLETLFLIHKPEMKKLPEWSKISDRLWLTQCKLHDISLTTTALCRTNHSNSIRELFRVFGSNLPKLRYFQSFRKIFQSLVALMMSINCLMLITLWTFGVDDPRLSSATWALYLYVMLIFNLCMQLFDAVSDTIIIYMNYMRRLP